MEDVTKMETAEDLAQQNDVQTAPPAEETVQNVEAAPEPSETMEDYADELKQSFRPITEGDLLTGTVIGATESEVSVDIGYYTEGVIPLEELSNDPRFSIRTDVQNGEEVTCLVLKTDNGDGRILLSKKKADDILAWEALNKALEDRTLFSVKIAEAVKGGCVTYLNGIRAFIPASQLSLHYVEDLSEWVGKTVDAIVITVDEEKRRLVLSSREVERDREKQDKESKISKLQKGLVTTGKIETLKPYGVFVNIGDGLSGLVHISQICGKRIKSPKEAVEEGQEVKVKIIDIKDGKISLSMKAVEDRDAIVEDVDRAPAEYKSGGEATTGLASLLAGIKLDQ
ncbi:30S ribosomal protein S1 [Anaerolentibacter hominis]|uniref:30S ribosomal protein S1 n=1 Tax=Anaerolentibacter hominis TaxID=3079009 RepID=UPI0031B84610